MVSSRRIGDAMLSLPSAYCALSPEPVSRIVVIISLVCFLWGWSGHPSAVFSLRAQSFPHHVPANFSSKPNLLACFGRRLTVIYRYIHSWWQLASRGCCPF